MTPRINAFDAEPDCLSSFHGPGMVCLSSDLYTRAVIHMCIYSHTHIPSKLSPKNVRKYTHKVLPI